MNEQLKNYLKSVSIWVITIVIFWLQIKLSGDRNILFTVCLGSLIVLQILNMVRGVYKYFCDKWNLFNVFSLIVFVGLNLVYILFCGYLFLFIVIPWIF